jgi:hypothetical protein
MILPARRETKKVVVSRRETKKGTDSPTGPSLTLRATMVQGARDGALVGRFGAHLAQLGLAGLALSTFVNLPSQECYDTFLAETA